MDAYTNVPLGGAFDMLYDSELKIMDILWDNDPIKASEIQRIAKERYGWSQSTTYAVITKCIHKGYIQRENPHFLCHSKLSRETAQKETLKEIVFSKLFRPKFTQAGFLDTEDKLSKNEIKEIKELIDNFKID